MLHLLLWCTCLLINHANSKKITQSQREYRHLNKKIYTRVLSMLAPMKPTPNQRFNTVTERNDNCEVVYMDKQCSDENDGPQHIFDELLSELSNCFIANPANPKVNDKTESDYFVFITRTKSACTEDVDMDAFCISMIEDEPIMHTNDIVTQSITYSGLYGLERLDIANGFASNFGDAYEGYHSSTMENNNLNIYVLDTNVLLNHEQFDDITGEKKYLASTASPFEPSNHGTHVAGTIVGKTTGLIRQKSVNLYSYGCCYSTSNSCSWSAITAGLETIINHCKAATGRTCVINFSVGGGRSSRYDQYLETLGDAIFVTAAGNSNQDACRASPAHHPDVISVGSYDSRDRRSYFSNYGSCVDAWGPGSSIWSSVASSTTSYATYSGTSMSSPAIAGVVGILRSINPSLTLEQLKSILSCQQYGFVIGDNDTPLGVQYGFGVAVADYYHIANNPNQCESLSTSKMFNIDFDDIVSTTISKLGQEILRRVTITNGPTDIVFTTTSGTAKLAFYGVNYQLMDSSDNGVLLLSNVVNGAYWFGVAGETGDSLVTMTQNTTPPPPTTSSPTISPTTSFPTSSPTTKFPTTTPTTTFPTSSCLGFGATCVPGAGDCCAPYQCKGKPNRKICRVSRTRNANNLNSPRTASANSEMNDKTSNAQTHTAQNESKGKIIGFSKWMIVFILFGAFSICIIFMSCVWICKKKRQSKPSIETEMQNMSDIIQTEMSKTQNIIEVDEETEGGAIETNSAQQDIM